MAAKSSVPIRDTQAKNVAALGGKPPTKDFKEIEKQNTPAGKQAPSSFRPAK